MALREYIANNIQRLRGEFRMNLEYNYKIMRKGKLIKKGMCTIGFKSGYETLRDMDLIKNNISINFKEVDNN